MDGYLRQSTASQSRLIGPFVDDTDFKTSETGLTIANTDIKLRANGTTLSNKNSGGGTHQANGHYSVTWDATDTANVGELKYSVVVAGALQVFGSYVVLEEAVYDALMAASAPGYVTDQPVNATKIGGTSQTGRDIGASVLLSSGTGTGQVKLSSGYVAPNWGDVGNPTTTVGLSGTTIKAVTDAGADTAGTTTLLSRLTATRAGYLDNLSAGAVATAAKLLSYFQSALRKDVTVDADIGGNYDDATDSQEAIRDRGDAAWTTATGFSTHSAADVWAVATRLLTAGTNIVLAKGTGVTGFNDLSAAQVNAEVDTALADYDGPTKAELDSAVAPLALEATLGTPAGASLAADLAAIEAQTDDIGVAGAGLTALASAANLATVAGYLDTEIASIKAVTDKLDDTVEDDGGTYRFTANALEEAPTGGSAPSAADIADAVWEEILADHSGTAGSTAEALGAAGSAGDPWATSLPGSYSSGQAGKIVGDFLDQAVSTVAQPGDAMTLTSGERSALATALLDLSNAIETGVTLRGAQRLMLAALAGKLSGAAGTTVTFRNAVADSKDRIVATVTSEGNRTAITTDQT